MVRKVLVGVVLSFAVVAAADSTPAELAEYKSTATAVTAVSTPPTRFRSNVPGHLGIHVEANAGAVKITNIEPNSAAEAAQLRVGDIVKSIAGQTVESTDAATKQLSNRQSGETIGMPMSPLLKVGFQLQALPE